MTIGRKESCVPKGTKVVPETAAPPLPPPPAICGTACWPPELKYAEWPLTVVRWGSARSLDTFSVRRALRKLKRLLLLPRLNRPSTRLASEPMAGGVKLALPVLPRLLADGADRDEPAPPPSVLTN